MELVCRWCHETKDESAFLKRNSALPFSQSNVRCCKHCNSRRNRERYCDPGIKTKQLRANTKWRREHPEKMAAYTAAFYERNPAQKQARMRVKHLLRRGYWTRQACCVCGSTTDVEAHHDSYAPAHWETVRWLCKEHHEKWHRLRDPIKSEIASVRLAEVDSIRLASLQFLRDIKELRRKFRESNDRATQIELDAWIDVMAWCDSNFEQFARSDQRHALVPISNYVST